MSELHKIDKPDGGYKALQLDEFLVFCILDTAVSYEMVCKSFDALKKSDMTTRGGIMRWRVDMIENTLRKSGYRFPKQHAKRIKDFGYSMVNLRTITRDEMVKEIRGIGYKLASMFLRNTRGEEYAVLDVHTLRWLQKRADIPDNKFKKMSYGEKEKLFIFASELMGKTVTELDLEIWEKNRIGNRNETN